MDESYRPRLSINITPEQQAKLWEYFEHGEQRIIFSVIIDDLIALLDEGGRTALSLIGANYIKPREVLPTLVKTVKELEKLKGEEK